MDDVTFARPVGATGDRVGDPPVPAISLLARLPDNVREQVWKKGVHRTIAAGDALHMQGAATDDVFFILDGVVKVSIVSERGTDLLLALHTAGEILGHYGALDGLDRPASAHAFVKCTVLQLSAATFRDLLAQSPPFARAIMSSLTENVRDLANHLVELSSIDTTALVASRLVEMATDARYHAVRHSDNGVIVLEPALSQHDLAGWAGVSDRSAAAALQEFRDRHLVRTARLRVDVIDLDGLTRRAAGRSHK